MSCGVGRRQGSDVVDLGLRRLAPAAPTGPLAWELPYAVGVALKRHIHKKIHIAQTLLFFLFFPFFNGEIIDIKCYISFRCTS